MSCPSPHYQYADITGKVLWMPFGHINPSNRNRPFRKRIKIQHRDSPCCFLVLLSGLQVLKSLRYRQWTFLLLKIDFSFRLLFLASAVRSSSSHRILQSPWFQSHPDDNASILVEVSINLEWRKNIFFFFKWNCLTSTLLTSSSSATIPLRSSSDKGPSSSADKEFSF